MTMGTMSVRLDGYKFEIATFRSEVYGIAKTVGNPLFFEIARRYHAAGFHYQRFGNVRFAKDY